MKQLVRCSPIIGLFFLSKAPFTPAWTWPARCVHLGVSLKVNSTLGRTLLCLGSHRPRASTYKKMKKSWERLRDFKYLAPKKDLSEQFFVICGQTSWSSALKNPHYLDHTSAYVHAKGHYCNLKTVGVDAWQKPKMLFYLYIYKIAGIFGLCQASTPTVFKLQ